VNDGRGAAGSRATPAAAARPAGRRAHLCAPLLRLDDLLILRGARTKGSGSSQRVRHTAAAPRSTRCTRTMSASTTRCPRTEARPTSARHHKRAARRAAPARRGASCPPRPSPGPPRARAPAPLWLSSCRPPPAPSPASPRAPAPPHARTARHTKRARCTSHASPASTISRSRRPCRRASGGACRAREQLAWGAGGAGASAHPRLVRAQPRLRVAPRALGRRADLLVVAASLRLCSLLLRLCIGLSRPHTLASQRVALAVRYSTHVPDPRSNRASPASHACTDAEPVRRRTHAMRMQRGAQHDMHVAAVQALWSTGFLEAGQRDHVPGTQSLTSRLREVLARKPPAAQCPEAPTERIRMHGRRACARCERAASCSAAHSSGARTLRSASRRPASSSVRPWRAAAVAASSTALAARSASDTSASCVRRCSSCAPAHQ